MLFIDTNVFLNYLYETPLSDKAEKILIFVSFFSASKSVEIEEIAKKLGIKLGRAESNDLERVRKILSKGVQLSEIVRD